MVRINILCCVALISLIGVSCTSNEVEELIDCSQSTLSLVLLNAQDASSCAESDGEILVGAQGGSGALLPAGVAALPEAC